MRIKEGRTTERFTDRQKYDECHLCGCFSNDGDGTIWCSKRDRDTGIVHHRAIGTRHPETYLPIALDFCFSWNPAVKVRHKTRFDVAK